MPTNENSKLLKPSDPTKGDGGAKSSNAIFADNIRRSMKTAQDLKVLYTVLSKISGKDCTEQINAVKSRMKQLSEVDLSKPITFDAQMVIMDISTALNNSLTDAEKELAASAVKETLTEIEVKGMIASARLTIMFDDKDDGDEDAAKPPSPKPGCGA